MICLHPRCYAGKVFPCGKCPACLSRDREELAQRLIIEAHVSKCSYFITLTYDDEHLPIYQGVNCFDKEQVRSFIRALRDSYRDDGVHFRYFVTSEYGDNTQRSHYHAIFFYDSFESRQQVYEDIKKRWTFGNISVDSVTIASARYVAKYCLKEDDSSEFPKGHPCRPFRLFSCRPAIGCSPAAIRFYCENWHLQESFIHQDETGFVKSCQLIDKIPRVVRSKIVVKKIVKKKVKLGDGSKVTIRHEIKDLNLEKKLSAVGWSKFFSMNEDLFIALNDKHLNTFDGKNYYPDYTKDLEIKKKARKLRKIKKTTL